MAEGKSPLLSIVGRKRATLSPLPSGRGRRMARLSPYSLLTFSSLSLYSLLTISSEGHEGGVQGSLFLALEERSAEHKVVSSLSRRRPQRAGRGSFALCLPRRDPRPTMPSSCRMVSRESCVAPSSPSQKEEGACPTLSSCSREPLF